MSNRPINESGLNDKQQALLEQRLQALADLHELKARAALLDKQMVEAGMDIFHGGGMMSW